MLIMPMLPRSILLYKEKWLLCHCMPDQTVYCCPSAYNKWVTASTSTFWYKYCMPLTFCNLCWKPSCAFAIQQISRVQIEIQQWDEILRWSPTFCRLVPRFFNLSWSLEVSPYPGWLCRKSWFEPFADWAILPRDPSSIICSGIIVSVKIDLRQ